MWSSSSWISASVYVCDTWSGSKRGVGFSPSQSLINSLSASKNGNLSLNSWACKPKFAHCTLAMMSEGTSKHFSTIACHSCSSQWDDKPEACLSRARSSKWKFNSVNSHSIFCASSTGIIGKLLCAGGERLIWSSSKVFRNMALTSSRWWTKFGSRLCARSPSRRKSRYCWPDKGEAKLPADRTHKMQAGRKTVHVAKDFMWQASLVEGKIAASGNRYLVWYNSGLSSLLTAFNTSHQEGIGRGMRGLSYTKNLSWPVGGFEDFLWSSAGAVRQRARKFLRQLMNNFLSLSSVQAPSLGSTAVVASFDSGLAGQSFVWGYTSHWGLSMHRCWRIAFTNMDSEQIQIAQKVTMDTRGPSDEIIAWGHLKFFLICFLFFTY